jgi:hypothetical protein
MLACASEARVPASPQLRCRNYPCRRSSTRLTRHPGVCGERAVNDSRRRHLNNAPRRAAPARHPATLVVAAGGPGPHRVPSDREAPPRACLPFYRSTPCPARPGMRRPRPSAGVARVGASIEAYGTQRPRRSIMSRAAAEGLFATGIPKPARMACFSAADSPPGPSSLTMAPACPICLPAGASKPAI